MPNETVSFTIRLSDETRDRLREALRRMRQPYGISARDVTASRVREELERGNIMPTDLVDVYANESLRCFVRRIDGREQHFGFSFVLWRSYRLWRWLSRRGEDVEVPRRAQQGAVEAFKRYWSMRSRVRELCKAQGTVCTALMGELVSYEECPVEVTFEDRSKQRGIVKRCGLSWLPEPALANCPAQPGVRIRADKVRNVRGL